MQAVTRIAALAALALMAGCSSPTPCNTVRDCAAGERCANKQCQSIGSSPGALGDSCNTDQDCGAGLGCNPLAIGFPQGYCTANCATASCTAGVCTALSSGSSVCTVSCAADADCRQGYVCCPTASNTCLPPGACTPAACTRPVAASALPSAQVVSLGTRKVGDAVTFDVPPSTGSITILHQARIAGLQIAANGQTFDNSAVPQSLIKPDGTEAYHDPSGVASSADGGTDPSGLFAMFGGGQPSTAAFTIPNTTASLNAGLPAGTWKFVVNDYANECAGGGCDDGGTNADTYDVSVLLRPLPAGNNLDVNFYIVGTVNDNSGQPFTAASAANDPSAKRMVQTFTSIYNAASIHVRTVTFYDVSGAAQAEFGTNVSADASGPCDLLDQMFTLSGAHPANTINLFLVQSIRQSASGTQGGTVVGVDGSIPGPTTLSGTVHSGAAVSLADLFAGPAFCQAGMDLGSCGADRVAYIAAHETGHFLGMFHTTEMEGADFDPLTDTPRCPCIPCASASDQPKCGTSQATGQALVTAQRCATTSCGGGDNLMFWLLDDAVSLGKLSAMQSQVMRLNPAVQP